MGGHMSYVVYDDIEDESGTMNEETARRLTEYLSKCFWSIECIGDRFPHGVLYDRGTGKRIGGWASLPPTRNLSEILG